MEIERKFLVTSADYKDEAFDHHLIKQGFLSTDPERTIRIRVSGHKGYLTIKGMSNAAGTSRMEWEYEIDGNEAQELLGLCEGNIIEKIRYLIQSGDHLIEVDEFQGANMGLVVAEVELKSEDEVITKPNWIGEEVTGDPKYYNAQLSLKPFNQWD